MGRVVDEPLCRDHGRERFSRLVVERPVTQSVVQSQRRTETEQAERVYALQVPTAFGMRIFFSLRPPPCAADRQPEDESP